ncbi:hypothetical protein CSKR_105578 [Clonorchis sinensis]|uniref:Uncharacterized protein n=1 Tax=Clonorchis sinensis TaxID=79923 RepID=A0A3R7ERT0_CLOSI|nr:hypothetical protein CSKR_105578 [Clonorchis sinensis]
MGWPDAPHSVAQGHHQGEVQLESSELDSAYRWRRNDQAFCPIGVLKVWTRIYSEDTWLKKGCSSPFKTLDSSIDSMIKRVTGLFWYPAKTGNLERADAADQLHKGTEDLQILMMKAKPQQACQFQAECLDRKAGAAEEGAQTTSSKI